MESPGRRVEPYVQDEFVVLVSVSVPAVNELLFAAAELLNRPKVTPVTRATIAPRLASSAAAIRSRFLPIIVGFSLFVVWTGWTTRHAHAGAASRRRAAGTARRAVTRARGACAGCRAGSRRAGSATR